MGKAVKYEVFYTDVLIGILTVDEDSDQYAYSPVSEGVSRVREKACLLKVMENGTDGFVPSIPFFANRLMNMKRWNLHQVNYQTDKFLIREIME